MASTEKVSVIYTLKDNASKGIEKLGATMKKLAIVGVAGAAAAIVGLTLFLKKASAAAQEQSRVLAQMDATLEATGGVVGRTKDEIVAYSQELAKNTAIADEVINEGQNMLLTFKNLRGEAFEKATKALLDMNTQMTGGKVTAESLRSQAIQLGKALNDPITGVSALTRVGVTFTQSQKDQIKVLQESGDVMGAQTIILKELEGEFGGAAAANAKTFQGALRQLNNVWGDLTETIGKSTNTALRPFVQVMTEIIESTNRLIKRQNKQTELTLEQSKKRLAVADYELQQLNKQLEELEAARDGATRSGKKRLDIEIKNLAEQFMTVGDLRAKHLKAVQDAESESKRLILIEEKKHVDEVQRLKDEEELNEKIRLKRIADDKAAALKAERDAIISNNVKIAQDLSNIGSDIVKNHEANLESRKTLETDYAADVSKISTDTARTKEDLMLEFSRKVFKDSDERLEAETTLNQALEDLAIKDERARSDLASTLASEKKKLMEEEKTVAQQVAQGTLDIIKNQLNKQLDAWIAAEIIKAQAAAPLSLGLSLLAIAPIAAVGAVGKAAIASVKLSEGGSFIADGRTSLGNGVIAGEAGPEKVTVEPLSSSGGGSKEVIILSDDGTMLAKGIYRRTTAMLKSGQLAARR
jgi:hypothetical protein